MNGHERIALTVWHREPDRVPVMCQLSFGHYLLNTGIPPHELWYSSEAMAEAFIRLQRRYRFDGILINLPGRPESYLADVRSIETSEDGEQLTWKNGDITIMPWDDLPHHYPKEDSRPDRIDFETFDPDHMEHLDDYAGYLWNTYHIQSLPGKADHGPLEDIPDYFFRVIDTVKADVGEEVSIHGEVFSPFTHFMELLGYENGLMALIVDPGKARAILARLTGAVEKWTIAQINRGVDAILISSAFAGAPFLSRKQYQEFVLPYERMITDTVKQNGLPVYIHTCGRIGDRLDLMEQTGTLGIDTLDPPPLGNGDLAVAKRDFGDRLFFKGNLNSVAMLAYKTEEEVIAEASEKIQIGKPGAGYILSTACSVAPRVEPWKLELLTPLAEKIGTYT
jgi:hypothetical protein